FVPLWSLPGVGLPWQLQPTPEAHAFAGSLKGITFGRGLCLLHPFHAAYFAIPKNTARLRSTSIIVSASMRPMAGPTLSRLTAIGLSIITCDGFCKPFSAPGL